MNERLKELRRALNMTQQEFADKIHVKRNTVATYELGRSMPSDAALSLICKTFDVNEDWLRNGTGEMFIKITRDEQIAAFMGDVLKEDSADFRRRFIAMLAQLGPDEWKLLESMAIKMADTNKTSDDDLSEV